MKEINDSYIEIKSKATNSNDLSDRLLLNKKHQQKDFSDWLFKRLNVLAGESVLDVGCGTGAQTLRFLHEVGKKGKVNALDISSDSIMTLCESCKHDRRLTAVVDDMANLNSAIKNQFKDIKYTLAHSSYALYYSLKRIDVLKIMAESLYDFGRLAVFTPVTPHGMVDIAKKFGEIPAAVLDSLRFGPDILEEEFRKLFFEVEIHFFQSEVKVLKKEDFISFYKSTTYFRSDLLHEIEKYAEEEIVKKGMICYEKNGYLILGRDRR